MKSRMVKLFVASSVILSLCLMGCEPSEDAEGPVSKTVKDADGNVYPTMKLGKQIWMAKNLNVNVDGSVCYDNDPANCEKYGRLYTWNVAKKACPAGWRLPTKEEFETFLEAVKARLAQIETQKKLNAEPLRSDETNVSKNLRSMNWRNGFDTFGFSALPAGLYGSGSGDFYGLGSSADFWASTENFSYHAYYLGIDGGSASLSSLNKDDARSVRCLQDSN